MTSVRSSVGAVAAILLCACIQPPVRVNLTYEAPPGTQMTAVAGAIIVGTFSDERGRLVPSTLGLARGLVPVESATSVAKVVESAFAAAVRLHGFAPQGAPAKSRLSGKIRKLSCLEDVAEVDLELHLVDLESNKPVLVKSYAATDQSNLRCASSPEDLRDFLERTLRRVIDSALYDPDLRSAARGKAG